MSQGTPLLSLLPFSFRWLNPTWMMWLLQLDYFFIPIFVRNFQIGPKLRLNLFCCLKDVASPKPWKFYPRKGLLSILLLAALDKEYKKNTCLVDCSLEMEESFKLFVKVCRIFFLQRLANKHTHAYKVKNKTFSALHIPIKEMFVLGVELEIQRIWLFHVSPLFNNNNNFWIHLIQTW